MSVKKIINQLKLKAIKMSGFFMDIGSMTKHLSYRHQDEYTSCNLMVVA
jgi:hypothetical protein